MLDSLYISKSKIRRDLLILFFTNPSQKYYLRELERLLSYSAGSIRRELLKFQKDNLFSTQRQGNLLYYLLNTKHPLFKELKSIISKTIGIEGLLKKLLLAIGKINAAFIYGSFASGKEKFSSDIDLFIIGEIKENILIDKINKLEKKLQREINYSLYLRKDFFKKKIENDPFIKDVLINKKIFIIGTEKDLG